MCVKLNMCARVTLRTHSHYKFALRGGLGGLGNEAEDIGGAKLPVLRGAARLRLSCTPHAMYTCATDRINF